MVANNTAVAFAGNIGDGPNGSAGTGSGDFDIYELNLTAGDSITVDIDTASPTGALDPLVAIVDLAAAPPPTPFIIAFNDDDPFATSTNFDSFLEFTAFDNATYYVVVGGFRSPAGGSANAKIPSNLAVSGSGPGFGSEGDYDIIISRNSGVDFFSVPLKKGDVIGAASDVKVELAIISPTTKSFLDEGQGSNSAFPGLLPLTSPLPTTLTGNEVSNVARSTGNHYVRVRTATTSMSYNVTVSTHTPPSATLPTPQGLYFDFDGATGVNAMELFGGMNTNATLSPLSSFLADWSLAPSDEEALINAIIGSALETVLRPFCHQPWSRTDHH